MKKKSSILIIVILLAASHAFSLEFPKLTSWVNDYAEVLDSEEKQELDATLKDFEQETAVQIFVAIMEHLPPDISLEEYVNKLFNHWGIGQKEKNNGVLLAIFIKDRKLRIEVGYGLEETLTNTVCKRIIDTDIIPDLKKGDFYNGIKKGLQSIISAISEE
jgi:uncharacterized protein